MDPSRGGLIEPFLQNPSMLPVEWGLAVPSGLPPLTAASRTTSWLPFSCPHPRFPPCGPPALCKDPYATPPCGLPRGTHLRFRICCFLRRKGHSRAGQGCSPDTPARECGPGPKLDSVSHTCQTPRCSGGSVSSVFPGSGQPESPGSFLA